MIRLCDLLFRSFGGVRNSACALRPRFGRQLVDMHCLRINIRIVSALSVRSELVDAAFPFGLFWLYKLIEWRV